LRDNRHLNSFVESMDVNVGGSGRDVKANSLPMPVQSVGGVIVVGGWESQPQGEGRQRRVSPERMRPEPDEVQARKAASEGVRTGR
jgi:hypothetical protein